MSTTLPPWDQLSFTFGTDPEVLTSVRQCSNITYYWSPLGDGQVANPPPTAPYNVVVYAAGMEPLLIPMNNSATTGQSRWIANLPAGQSYAISMKDSKGYTGGVLTPMAKMVAGTGCNTANNLLKTSSLDVAVSGNSQCGQAIVAVNNGTAPYTVEVVAANNGQQKSIHFSSSPFSLVLDMSEGVEYFLSVSDSAGHSSVKGLYTVGSSSDNSCLGAATTVSAGKFSTLYPGGTASTTSATASASSGSSSPKLASSAIIAMAVAIPVAAIILILLALWLCYKRNRRQKSLNAGEKPEIDVYDPSEHNAQGGYTPVPTGYHLGSTPNTSSYHDLSSTSGSQHPLAVTPYRLDIASDRQTISTMEGPASASAMTPSSGVTSEKRRNLLNPDSHGLGPIASEPFDMPSPGGHSSHSMSQPRMPPLPPAYSASPGSS